MGYLSDLETQKASFTQRDKKLSSILPNNLSFQEIAVVDIGSNAIRMIYAQLHGNRLHIIHKKREFLRLGADVFSTGRINDASIESLGSILQRFSDHLPKASHLQTFLVATSAMRDAQNYQEVIQSIHRKTGWSIQVISGIEEAQFIFEGIQSCLELEDDPLLLGDLGGGSLEVTIVKNKQIIFQNSFDLGALRLCKLNSTERANHWFPIQKQLSEFFATHAIHSLDLILTGGNAKTIAKLIEQSGNAVLSQPLYVGLHWSVFLQFCKNFSRQPITHYVEAGQLSEDQAQVVPSSLFIFENLGLITKCDQLTIPLLGLKEGVLLNKAQAKIPGEKLELVHFLGN